MRVVVVFAVQQWRSDRDEGSKFWKCWSMLGLLAEMGEQRAIKLSKGLCSLLAMCL